MDLGGQVSVLAVGAEVDPVLLVVFGGEAVGSFLVFGRVGSKFELVCAATFYGRGVHG